MICLIGYLLNQEDQLDWLTVFFFFSFYSGKKTMIMYELLKSIIKVVFLKSFTPWCSAIRNQTGKILAA